jgi:hypothetical protein
MSSPKTGLCVVLNTAVPRDALTLDVRGIAGITSERDRSGRRSLDTTPKSKELVCGTQMQPTLDHFRESY